MAYSNVTQFIETKKWPIVMSYSALKLLEMAYSDDIKSILEMAHRDVILVQL